jgi:hypothetical protein
MPGYSFKPCILLLSAVLWFHPLATVTGPTLTYLLRSLDEPVLVRVSPRVGQLCLFPDSFNAISGSVPFPLPLDILRPPPLFGHRLGLRSFRPSFGLCLCPGSRDGCIPCRLCGIRQSRPAVLTGYGVYRA